MSFRRMLPFLLLNVLVSAMTMLAILYWWDNRGQTTAADPGATAVPPSSIPLATNIPVEAATNTPEPEEDEGPVIHVVKAGDTLGNLSTFYDVSLEDLMAANNLTDPNILSVGQELIIPIGGLATATPIPTEPAADILPSPIPTEELVSGEVNVVITTVTGVGSLTEEAVQIANFGSGQIALQGWELADENGHVFKFGQVTLFGDGAAIQVHTEAGQNGPADQYWGLETAVWESGEHALLRGADGNTQSTFIIP
ncbi:MAG: lamin tail domain-containing protein [Ardenticatenaceae bacterium]|nr:lamin tail domain-containing protein [Ardenticatenaceae bacterium]MCB9443766.1 lamin tail domain-containing protein [Ardenticatenaceae bacterium]